METLTFDIETIPQQTPLSDAQQTELNKKLERYFWNKERTAEAELEATRMLMGTNPFLGQIICIGLMRQTNNNVFDAFSLIGDEKTGILEPFWNFLSKFENGMYISFNGLSFDVPFILKRSMIHGLPSTNNYFTNTRRFQKYPHFDVLQIVSDWNSSNSVKLDLVCDQLGIQTPKGGDIEAKDVEKAYLDGRIKEISDYCLRDVKATYKVYQIVRQYVYMDKY